MLYNIETNMKVAIVYVCLVQSLALFFCGMSTIPVGNLVAENMWACLVKPFVFKITGGNL